MTGPRPTVKLCLASSLDGRIKEGASNARYPNFTSRYDRQKLFRLRAESDLILVGANTVRQEGLPPLIRDEALMTLRAEKSPHPAVAIVTGTGDLPWQGPYFQKRRQSMMILTGRAASPLRETLKSMEIGLVETGATLDLADGINQLGRLGHTKILAEGGGRLVHSLLLAGLVDELHLTLAPVLMGGHDAPLLCTGPDLNPLPSFRLCEVNQVGDELHLVYRKG